MSILREKVVGFLEADGFVVDNNIEKFVVARHTARTTPDGVVVAIALAVFETAQDAGDSQLYDLFFQLCQSLLDNGERLDIRAIRKKGLSLTGFREAAKTSGIVQEKTEITIQAPVQFFDTAYVVDHNQIIGEGGGDRLGRWISKEFGTRAEDKKRVRQPYFLRDKSNWGGHVEVAGNDLLDHLKGEIQSAGDEPMLRLVVGAAGIGKSVLFDNLLHELYADFQDAKRRHEDDVPRPTPFLPKPIWEARRAGTKITSISDVVTAVRNTPGAAPTSNGELFDWLLANGYTTWLFDGLDEFYGSDDTFLPYLFARIKGTSSAKIIVFMRDSLLSSSALLSDYVAGADEEVSARTKIYQLAPWGKDEQRALINIKLEGQGDVDEIARHFTDEIEAKPELTGVAPLPFYCNLLADQFIDEKTGLSNLSEFELLDSTLKSMLKREEEKLIPSSDIFRDWKIFHDRERLLELLSYIGHKFSVEQFRANEINQDYNGILQDELADIIEDSDFHPDCTDEEKNAGRQALIQFALFSAGGDKGFISFSHEIMADYLAAFWAVGVLDNGAGLLPDAIGRFFFSTDTVFCRYLVSELQRRQQDMTYFIEALVSDRVKVWHRRNIIQILCLANPDRRFLSGDISILKERDLTGLQFSDLDLSNASFEDCDLTNVVFDNCILNGVDFTDARLRSTKFVNIVEGKLTGADFSDRDRFENIISDGQTIETDIALKEWCILHNVKH
ncbi:MAG: pentapeptide repeat-containing protein [Methyloligellaceae bacterium]